MGARNRCLSSSDPKAAMTGPTMKALKATGGGTAAACISDSQMWCWRGVQSWPPYSTGQPGTAMPAAFNAWCAVTTSSLESSRPSATLSRISWGTAVVKISRIRAWKARSSSLSRLSMPAMLPGGTSLGLVAGPVRSERRAEAVGRRLPAVGQGIGWSSSRGPNTGSSSSSSSLSSVPHARIWLPGSAREQAAEQLVVVDLDRAVTEPVGPHPGEHRLPQVFRRPAETEALVEVREMDRGVPGDRRARVPLQRFDDGRDVAAHLLQQGCHVDAQPVRRRAGRSTRDSGRSPSGRTRRRRARLRGGRAGRARSRRAWPAPSGSAGPRSGWPRHSRSR